MADKVEQATASMVANLEAKTGKSMADWVAIVKKLGALKHGEIVKHLKAEYALGHGYANLIAHTAAGNVGAEAPPADDLVEAQFAGDRAGLRPIYDRLVKEVQAFGNDVEVSPKKANVSIRRSKQFAIFQPSTKARFDVGINLKGVKPVGRLEAAGSFNSMVTHRVRLEKLADVDAELIAWLKQAYEGA